MNVDDSNMEGSIMRTETLKHFAKVSHDVVTENVDGLTDAQALIPLYEGGSHFNWLLGHMVAYRDGMLEMLGAERVRTAEEDKRYAYGSSPEDSTDARPLAEQVAAFRLANERLLAALDSLTEEQLAQPRGDGTVGSRLDFGLWHDAYHSGQAILYRRAVGLSNPTG